MRLHNARMAALDFTLDTSTDRAIFLPFLPFMLVESAVPARKRSSDASNAKMSGTLFTEVNGLSDHRTSPPPPASGRPRPRRPRRPGATSPVTLTSSPPRRPSISTTTTTSSGTRPTLDEDEAEEADAPFACAAFPVRKRLVSASRSMEDGGGGGAEEEDEDDDAAFSSAAADVPTLPPVSLAQSRHILRSLINSDRLGRGERRESRRMSEAAM